MELVNDLSAQRCPAPAFVGPDERIWIDYLRRLVWPVGLPSRRGIGIQLRLTVQTERITIARGRANGAGEVTIALGVQGCGLRADDDLNVPCRRRPDAHVRQSVPLILGANRKPTMNSGVKRIS